MSAAAFTLALIALFGVVLALALLAGCAADWINDHERRGP